MVVPVYTGRSCGVYTCVCTGTCTHTYTCMYVDLSLLKLKNYINYKLPSYQFINTCVFIYLLFGDHP